MSKKKIKRKKSKLPPELGPQEGRMGKPGSRIKKKASAKKKGSSYYRSFVKVVTSEYAILSVLGAFIGVLAALGAWMFREMIKYSHIIFIGRENVPPTWSISDLPYGYFTVIAPAIGGIIVGLLIYYLAPEVRGGGMSHVMEAVAVKGGRIRPRVVALKALASAITIGSGGSVGREGPIVQVGSAVGSTVGQKFKMPDGWTKILVACGATGAVTATFNTPIAGVIFSLELILIELKTRSFIPLVVTSVVAKVVSNPILGDTPAFAFTEALLDKFVLKSPFELLIYLLLGVFAGLISVLFVRSVYSIEKIFDTIRTKPYIRPMIGGILIGLIALIFPQVLGVGYETVDAVLKGTDYIMPIYLLISLVFIKIIATSISVGSGGSGGFFSPSLFIGAMLGGAFGMVANNIFPDQVGPAGAYAVVGMAALFAAAGRATFTAIIMIFEMTLSYDLILPVMFACVVSDAVSSVLMKESIFTWGLAKKGVKIVHDMEVNLLEAITVKEAMVERSCVLCVTEDTSIGEVYSQILKTEHMGFPVMDRSGRCCGIITFHDVDRAMSHGYVAEPARWFCSRRPVVTYRNETLEDALQKMQKHDISHLPVVSRKEKKKLRGFITKGDVLKTYAKRHLQERKRRSYYSIFSKKKKKRS